MKKTISHIITGLGTGGAERSLFNLLSGPLGKEFDHSVISLTSMGTYGTQLSNIGIDVTALGIKREPWAAAALPKLLRSQSPDIVQGWMYHGNLAASFARPRNSKLLWNVRNSLDNLAGHKRTTRWAIQANARFSTQADRVIFNAETARRQHIAAGFEKENTQTIPNGFDVKIFQFDKALRAKLRQNLNIPEGATVVGQLGRFHPFKDHEGFFAAGLGILRDNQDVHLLLAGRGVSYKTPFFRDQIPESLSSRVHLLGDRRDVNAVLSAMDIFVQSSRAEGFPNVLGEAMCVGRACIATEVGDSAQVLDDTGVIIQPKDPIRLGAAIRKLLNDPKARVLYGDRARKRIETTFPLDMTIKAYASLYHSFF